MKNWCSVIKIKTSAENKNAATFYAQCIVLKKFPVRMSGQNKINKNHHHTLQLHVEMFNDKNNNKNQNNNGIIV